MATPRRTTGTIPGTKHLTPVTYDWRARQAERGRLMRLSQVIEANAACADEDPDLFHPKNAEEAEAAKRVCRGCPVVGKCLMQALRIGDEYAVLGATTPRERAALRRHLAQKRLEAAA
ncbi:WhiB family transcriptional regulator [Streptomyces sp. NPDC047022]|uniref:WhiB family transcriptional regulator n=1 Tax=Streptomyces sp. NPDC047022 TaxID=3155737 RepID=UPI0033ECA9B0